MVGWSEIDQSSTSSIGPAEGAFSPVSRGDGSGGSAETGAAGDGDGGGVIAIASVVFRGREDRGWSKVALGLGSSTGSVK